LINGLGLGGFFQVGDSCSTSADCGAGQWCFDCEPKFSGSHCVRSAATNPFQLIVSLAAGLRFVSLALFLLFYCRKTDGAQLWFTILDNSCPLFVYYESWLARYVLDQLQINSAHPGYQKKKDSFALTNPGGYHVHK